ncbi:aminopeptidase N [Aggregatibacter actinomycetemcomitans]|uniref:aminopeptidase N n=1 Tax=Aggregatibacter actinomycetemcomitans TaxID=714 RepID=UPI0001B9F35E|nr:aminopeptidase N [Aggregatibacter actinomycetemcomitans]AEW77622.1 aminopeptidase N [Aggregatibacter actinomycetemcomitans ANH9381]ACX82721.1 aminopeptidase N [Aggregatibacter actinomycetemcomitans D11S-1]AHN72327.1 aminopeptidase N, putative [Aggregatibacter actinomycetemcomitans HK1651]AMQ91743.1 aminopeptidase [Aggregatibacter actinomycetemcomitans]KND83171.1 aminopeptidase N [Aggregatibacter actinomycetemcomitans serotype b str. SCC1398]
MYAKAKYRKDYQTPDFTVTDIYLDFQLEPEKTIVVATSKYQRLNEKSTTLRLDGHDFQFSSIKLNGKPFSQYQQDHESLTLDLVQVAAEQFELEITTVLNPAANTSLQGLYQSGDAFCTQCEAEGFRQITYMLDRPDVLARYTTKITADKAKYPYLLSNGNRIAGGDLDDGRHWVEWNDPFPKPSYLFALVAGGFDVLQDKFVTKSGREVALELYVNRGNLDRADWAMQSLKRAMKWDEDRFGLEYDLDIYMIVAVDFFNMGAMENKGLNIFNDKYVLANPQTATDDDYLAIESVIAHEYFHNWTGNRVTCRDWFQLSLKEGLTVFRDQEFSSDTGSRPVNRINNVKFLRTVQFAEDAGPMAHPIRPEKVIEMNNFYTVTVYEKGAEVIRMLHTLLGEKGFQKGMKLYIAENDGKAATCEDFVSAMERANELDLTQFRRWYSQSGTPELTISDRYDEKNHVYQLQVSQLTPPTADQMEKVNLHIPLKIALYDENGVAQTLYDSEGVVDNVLNITQKDQTFEFHNIYTKPVPALLSDFSAPVKLDYDYKTSQLITLVKFAENGFIRWDAVQMLLNAELRRNVSNYQQGIELDLSAETIAVLQQILTNYQKDIELTSLILTLPKATEFAELFKTIDPDTISAVREFMARAIAENLQELLFKTYNQIRLDEYKIERQDIALRKLRNVCLSYLAYTNMGNNLVNKHYSYSNNMTDTLAALTAATQAKLPCRDNLLADFEQKWQQDGLVMDKWFALQASRPEENVLNNVMQLMEHPSFNFNNPNRVRSLVGTFAGQNLKAFHAIDGSGYRFLTDILIKLNKSNPQVASRLIEPLIRFVRYDAQRQTLMKRALERISETEDLSRDLYEKIEKALQ